MLKTLIKWLRNDAVREYKVCEGSPMPPEPAVRPYRPSTPSAEDIQRWHRDHATYASTVQHLTGSCTTWPI